MSAGRSLSVLLLSAFAVPLGIMVADEATSAAPASRSETKIHITSVELVPRPMIYVTASKQLIEKTKAATKSGGHFVYEFFIKDGVMGSAGYAYFGELGWVDALLNAAMILTGMGPVDRMVTTSGKLFAAFYALYSGIAFLSMMAIIIAPILHRFLHRLHLEE